MIYEKLYHIMFNAVTDAVELLPECPAREMLIRAQQDCEELYVNAGEGEDAETDREGV